MSLILEIKEIELLLFVEQKKMWLNIAIFPTMVANYFLSKTYYLVIALIVEIS